jgi:hypothetical protein
MRQTISGLVAAIAVVSASAVPAMACGYSPCGQPQVYVAPVYSYSGCDTGCGWARERLPDPVQQYYSQPAQQQYYYVNQGPTYTGPGNWAPLPTYQEGGVSGWNGYQRRPYAYGYNGGRYANAGNHYYDGVGVEGPRMYNYPAHRQQYRPWRPRTSYYHAPRVNRYGYAPRYGYTPRHAYAPRYAPAPYHQGQRALRRYY